MMLSLQFAINKSFKSTTRCFLLNRTLPIRTMKIYTKTGDKGTSALWTGERFDKNNHIFESLGSIDELNAHLGLVSSYLLFASMVQESFALAFQSLFLEALGTDD